ncbi:MAG: class I SAM-dependent methyltransferase [bacterium]|nr:class I SAM-dependent methyltransferase [bacterium]
MKIKLSPEEETTLKTYAKMAKNRNKQIGGQPFDPDFWADQFEEFKRLLPAGNILEIGCGNGRDARFFCKDTEYNYFGIDACQGLLDEAKIWAPNANTHQMNLYSLFFPDHSFDGFWAASVYVHIPRTTIMRALAELKRVIKPEGIGFVVMREGKGETTPQDKKTGLKRFYALYPDDEFSDILLWSGFEIISKSKDTRNKPELIYFVRTWM